MFYYSSHIDVRGDYK